MRYAVLGLAATFLTYAQQGTPIGILLPQIKAKMAENLSRLPDYTCAQTTERFRRHAANRPFEPVDKVRLEVALVEGKELYGWPGSNRIEESNLDHLIGEGGALTNGSFALLARGVFLSTSTVYNFKGVFTREGTRAYRFDYEVPSKASLYHLRVGEVDDVVGYHGSFWANADTLDLMRLEIYAEHIPEELGLSAVSDLMEYAPVKIGDSSFLLPRTSELSMATASGVADLDRTRFHECHQFSSEALLSFSDAPEFKLVPMSTRPPEIDLPDDFQVDIALTTPIDTSTAVGDEVQAKLLRAIKNGHDKLFSKGALLAGHVTQLHRDADTYHLGISFTDLSGEEGHADLSGRRNAFFVVTGLRDLRRISMRERVEQGFLPKGSRGAGQLSISGEKPFNLRTGYRISLRSRLLQSGK